MSKANDPFNFDDLYKQAGVDNLFVKKSMAEQKAMASRPGAATPPRPAAANGAASFGTSPTTHGETAPTVQPQSSRKGLSSNTATSGSSNSLKGLDLDPFASLGGLTKPPPMSASKSSPPSVPTSSRPPTPSQTVLSPNNHPAAAASTAAAVHSAAAHTFDLEDMFGPSPSSSPQRQQHTTPNSKAVAPSTSSDAFDDPFAAFGTVEEGAAAVPASPTPAAAKDPTPPAPAPQPSGDAQQPSTAAPEQHMGNSSTTEAAPVAAQARPSSAYFTQLDQEQHQRRQQQQQQVYNQQEGRYSSSNSKRYGAQADMPSSFSSNAAEQRHSAATAGGYVDGYGGSSSGAYDFGQAGYNESAGGGRGWGGLFKSVTKTAATLGKKGLKAAQAGLAQLESAIENLDRPAGSLSRTYSGSGGGGGAGPDDDGGYDLPAERVLSMAIHISELPGSRQEEALARLPRPVRQRVMALLREQAVIEGEEQLQQQHPPPPAARGSETGPGPAAVRSANVIQTREFDLSEHEAAATAAAAAGGVKSNPASAGTSTPAPPTSVAAAAAVQPPVASAATPAAASVVPQLQEDDLLGMSAAPPAAAAAAGTPPAASAKVASVADIDDFFSGGTQAAGTTRAAPAAAATAVLRPRSAGPTGGGGGSSSLSRVLSGSDGQLADLLGGGGSTSAAAAAGPAKSSSMIHLGGLETLDVDVGAHGDLYADAVADGSEPEFRRQLRAAREAEKHAKMKAALAEKQAKEAAEQQRRQEQQAHKQAHKDRIETWKNKNKGNVRGLLGSLQTVLWEDSGWKTIGMADLLEPAQVRKAWMKANLLVHPDKVRQRSGSDEQVAIADMIFDALKEAWGQFKG